jgi:hypothetical protein
MNIENIKTVIKNLSEKRKIFHSEADFQFAFAWEVQKELPQAEIRLEYCPAFAKDMHIDIFVIENGATYPIELKYKSKLFSDKVGDEYYSLKNHSAQDCGRYDYLFDIQRIERIKNAPESNFKAGYAIILTNDESYWKQSTRETVDEAFRIHQGRVLTGSFDWSEKASAGTKKGRPPFDLEGKYIIDWKEFSNIKKAEFMYNVVEVK